MRVVVDGLPIRGMSVAVVVEHLLGGWTQLDEDDDLHLVVGPEARLQIPEQVTVHRVDLGGRHYLGRLRAQATVIPALCRELRADVMLGVLPSTTVTRLPCPRAVLAWDLRHELRPAQFSRRARLLRSASYEIGYRQAAAIVTISERTREDLLRSRPWLGHDVVTAAPLGGDHVDSWPVAVPGEEYAIAFGQWANKNVDLVLDAWAVLRDRGTPMTLTIVGLDDEARARVGGRVAELRLDGIVRVEAWLDDARFRERFTSAAMVVFPSDFEGFGLPAAEAMRLGIPLVVSPDPALLEVTGGTAVVMGGWTREDLADAVDRARGRTPDELEAARTRSQGLTWRGTAARTRRALQVATERHDAARRAR